MKDLKSTESGIAAGQSVKEKQYWLEKLAGEWTKSHFYYDHSKPIDRDYQPGTVTFTITGELFSRLMKIISGSDAKLHMVLAAQLMLLLGKFIGSDDIIVGSPIYRQKVEGEFINTVLPLRTRLSGGDMTFKDLLMRVRQTVNEAVRNQNYPMDKLIYQLDLSASDGRFPLFDVALLLENIHDRRYIAHIPCSMIFSFLRTPDAVAGTVEYDSLLYDRASVERIVAHFSHLLEKTIFDVETPLAAVDGFSNEEKNQLLVDFNRTDTVYPSEKTLHKCFEEQVRKTPDNIALIGMTHRAFGQKVQHISYKELDRAAHCMAGVLQDRGVKAGSIVGIMAEPSMEMMAAVFAVLKAGGAYLPIDPNYPGDRINYMLEDSGAKVLLTNLSEGHQFNCQLLMIGEAQPATRNSQPAASLAYVIYTSGSTGKPKGVLIEHRNIMNYAWWRIQAYRQVTSDICLQLVSFSFDGFCANFYPGLLSGGALVYLDERRWRDTDFIRRVVREQGVTHFSVVPSMYRVLLDGASAGDFKSLRFVVLAGEKADADLIRTSRELFPHVELINEYGPTENAVTTTCCRDMTPGRASVIGVPIANNRIFILDDRDQLKPVGVPGELCISGAGLARGYLNRPELTAEKFNRSYRSYRSYKTGDLARWLPDPAARETYSLEILGRTDNQVQIRGFRVELDEIEAHLLACDDVKEAAVIVKQASGYNYLCAYIVAHDPFNETELRARLSGYLPDYMVPTYLIAIEQMPLTPNGKIDRKQLIDLEISTTAATEYLAPHSETQKKLVEIWQTFLEREQVGIRDNFFNIGGDSIKTIGLLSLVNKAFNTDFELVDLYENDTIETFAEKIESHEKTAAHNTFKEVAEQIEALREKILEQGEGILPGDREIQDIYPMSDIEKGMVYYSLRDSASNPTVYYDQIIYRMEHPGITFDEGIFIKAFDLLVKKHSILRTGFNMGDFEEPLQIVYKDIPIHDLIRHEDVSHLDRAEQEAHIEAVLAIDRKQPFDISRPESLWRIKTFSLDSENLGFVWIGHHALIDGWSSASLVTELNNIYLALQANPGFVSGTLKASYKDYVIEQLAVKNNKETIAFWKKELQDYKRLEFPGSSKSENKPGQIKGCVENLGTPLFESLAAAVKKYHTTVKNVCFAAYLYMLNMISYEENIVVGLVSNNRPTCEDGDKIIGCFLNTIPVRIKIPPRIKCSAFVQSVENKMLELKRYEKMSLLEIVRISGEETQEGNPFFDTIFNFVDFHVYDQLRRPEEKEQGSSPAGRARQVQIQGNLSINTLFNFDVNITMGHFLISLSYSDELIDETLASKCCGFFETFLHLFTREPESLLEKGALISPEEKQELLIDFNRSEAAYPHDKTLHELFESQVEKTPHNIAVMVQDFALTYRELKKKSARIAVVLKQKGFQPGDIAALILEPAIDMAVAILAVLKAGGAYLPIDPEYPGDRIDFMLKDSNARVLLRNIDLIKIIGPIGPIKHDPTHLCYVIYTSGTTGSPKGVLVEHHGMVNYTYWRIASYRLSGADITLQLVSFGFDGFYSNFYSSLLSGGTLVLVPRSIKEDIDFIRNIVKSSGVTNMSLVPGMYNALLNIAEAGDLASLRFVVLAGEKAPGDLITRSKAKGPHIRLINEYGPTEATVTAAANLSIEPHSTAVIGKPISNTRLYILDKWLHPLPAGVPGELCISGPGVAKGYLNLPQLTAEKFILPSLLSFSASQLLSFSLYRTGDRAKWLPDGSIEFLGRIDLQVKIRGFRIELEEIEHRLSKHPDVKEIVVTLKEDNSGEKYLCAYIVPHSPQSPIPQLQEYLSRTLPHYMIPTYFVPLEHMPLTPGGKVDRNALPETVFETGADYALPTNEIEAQLVNIWQEVLAPGEPLSIGIHDHFFRMGGHSLKAAVLVARVHKELNVKLTLAEVFKTPTIKGLAQRIKELEQDKYTSIEPVEDKEYYPLSPAQKRLYILQQMEADNISYNMPYTVPLGEDIDIDKLQETFKKLISRHETLRTSFRMIHNEPVQVIHNQVEFEITDKNFATFIKPFDLSRPPLLRVGVVKAYLLMVDMHHIITDGISQSILTKEFISLYAGEELPPLELRYRDYSQWQNSENRKKELKAQELFWLKEFEGEIPVLELPFDFPRPELQSFEGKRFSFALDEEKTSKLKDLARSREATLFMVLIAVYNVFLAKVSNREEIIVGTPTAGRKHADLEQVIGMFVNMLALKNHVNGEDTFISLLHRLGERALKAFDNQDYQFEDLVEKVSVERDTSRNPLFDVVFVLQDILETPEIEEVQEIDHDVNASKFDLTLTAVEMGKKLFFTFEYCTRLFAAETIFKFISYFKEIISAVVESPQKKIARIEIVTGEEKQRLLYQFNDTGAEYPEEKLIHGLFEEQATRTPDHIAVVDLLHQSTYRAYRTHLSYKTLNKKSNRLAGLLREKGVQPDTIAAIKVDHSVEMIVGLLAILKAGAAYLPIDPDYPEERIDYMLADSGAKVLLTNLSEGHPINCQLSMMGEALPATRNSQPATSLAYIIYTSGTTGKPKGMMIQHRNVVRLMFNDKFQFDFNHRDVWTMFHSFCFDFSVWEMYGALLYGGQLVIIPKITARDFQGYLEILKEKKVTVLNQTPSAFYHLMNQELKEPGKDLNLRYVIFGGEALNPGRLKGWKEKYPQTKLVNMYGITETTVHVTFKEIEKIEIQSDISNIGKPIPTLSTYVMDKNLKLVPIGTAGELLVGGEGVGRGYLNRPTLSKEKFVQNPYKPGEKLYRSGDLARLSANGELEYLGRIDEQVKIRGFRIELGEIENRLLKHKDIKEVVVTSGSDENGDRYLCAYIVPASPHSTITGLKEYLSKTLPDYMIPAYFMQIETIPLTPNGKIDRKALPGSIIEAGEDYAPPTNEIQSRLIKVWQEVLDSGEQPIGIDDNFFELGGHSLKATILTARIHKELNIKLPLAEIFKLQTIRELSEYIEQAGENKYAGIEPVEEKEYYPLSSAQKRLYFLQQMDADGTSYNIPLVLPLGRNIEKDKLETTLKKLIARHESLRTSFEMVNEVPVQKVRKPDDVEFAFEYDGHPDKINRFVRPFDLSRAPLIRSGLIKHPDGNFTWIVDIHHIVSDGTSHTILADDFIALYQGEEPEPLKFQYKDFSHWQNNLFETGRIKEQEEYWLQELSGEIPGLNLPNDYPRPPVFTFKGDNFSFMLDREDAVKFKALGARNGATLYMNILTALNTLFYKYTAQTDIIVGTGIAGRPHADLQRIIGMFVNTLAIRNYPRGDKTYESLLKEVITQSIKAFENQDLQFEELVDRLEPERDPSRNPLFDISMVVQNFRQVGEEEMLPAAGVDYKNPTTKVDMTFFVHESGQDVYIVVEYYTAVYKQETVKRFISHFKNIIQAVIKNPSLKLKDIEMISHEEKQKILYQFNRTEKEYPKEKTIHRAFEEQVEQTPHNIAIICEEHWLTYSRLEEQANRLSSYLYHSKGVKPGDRIGILLDRGIDTAVAILGILKAGGAYVPIESSFPLDRQEHIIKDANIGVLVSGKKHTGTLNRLQWENDCLHTYLCIDSRNVYDEKEGDEDEWMKMNRELWEHVGETAVDDITAGGWLSSYTGEPFSKKEMDEYGDNILKKMEPLLHKNMRVLEIGAASGISMYRLAPKVGLYYGTDLSPVIIEKNRQKIEKENILNIKLRCLPAHEIDRIEETGFDLIIMNSVIQAFEGHNYLRKVIKKSIRLLGERGTLFIGDIMDQDKKETMIRDLSDFKYADANSDKDYTTKTDFSTELFVSRMFWQDLAAEIKEIKAVEFSDKIYTIKNELTKFRYDTLIVFDKKEAPVKKWKKNKHQDDMNALYSFSPGALPLHLSSRSLAYIIYTSGSTGKPKGVAVEHRGLLNFIIWRISNHGYSRQDVTLQMLSYGFDAFATTFYSSLLSGGKLLIPTEEKILDYEHIAAAIKDKKVTNIGLVPGIFESLLEHPRSSDLERVGRVVTGGEKASQHLVEKSKAMFPRLKLINEYGPTETTITAAANLSMAETPTSIIGRPISNVRIYILDSTSRFSLQPVGAAGELCIAGDGLARGYLNNPELTAEKFNRSYKSYRTYIFYKTGDLGRWLPDGNIEFLGRIDQQVKIRGFRIELGEIESRLRKHDLVKEAVVLDRELDNSGDKYLCAYIVPARAGAVDGLGDYLSGQLPDYMIPTAFIEVTNIPKTPGGKVDRKALPAPRAAAGESESYAAPRDEIEKKLTAIWADVLNISPAAVGIDDNFFQLGGHSLKATVMIAKIHKELNIKMPLAEIFKTPTIRGLSASTKINAYSQDRYTPIEPAEKKEFYILSSAQKRLFILQQMEKESIAYNGPHMIVLDGKLDTPTFEKTFRKLITRHESLRTSIQITAEEPVQVIHPADDVTFEIEYHKTTTAPVEHILQQFVRPFDLSRVPFFRVGLIKRAEDRSILLVDMHHIITDGISSRILIKEFMALYGGEELPPLTLQYKDYAQWQHSEKQRQSLKQQEVFWLKLFEGEIPVLDVPLDFPRPPVQSFEGRTLPFEIENEEREALEKTASQQGVTLFTLVLAIYNTLLAKLSGQEDIIVGIDVAGRRHAELEPIIGMFVNALALRNFPAAEKTFKGFLKEVNEKNLEALENQDYPFEDLVERVSVSRDVSRNPLFDVVFAFIDMETEPSETPQQENAPLRQEPYNYENRTAKFDLTLNAVYTRENVFLSFEYCTKLFEQETIQRFVNYFKKILSAAVRDINREISQIEIISTEEKKQLLFDFNNTKKPVEREKTYARLFEEQAVRVPGKTAAVYKNRHITYRELDQKANRMAHYLLDRGVTAGAVVALHLERSIFMLVSIIGVFKAGGAYLPLELDYPKNRIEYILEDSGANIVIKEDIEESLPLYPGKNPGTNCRPGDLAYLIYTSGTTGLPKGVMIHQLGMINHLYAKIHDLSVTGEDVIAQTASSSFDISVWQFLAGLLKGGSTFIIARDVVLEPATFLQVLQKGGVTILESVPSLMTAFLENVAQQSDKTLDRLRWMIPTGEPLTVQLAREWYRHYPRIALVNAYGPTEASDDVTHYVIQKAPAEDQKTIPIGKPLQNLHIYILDKNLALCPVGVRGEICVAGIGVGKGYWKDDAKTNRSFIPNPYLGEIRNSDYATLYRTGDIGYFRSDGNIECLGRLDYQVKIRGNRIELGEIERRLLDFDGISEAVVTARENEGSDKFLCAYIVSRLDISVPQLRKFLSKHVPDYMIPAYFVFLAEMPRTVSGKIDRKSLPEPAETAETNTTPYAPPTNEIEKLLVETWENVLGRKKIGINDNFFMVGGDSIKSIQIVSRMNKAGYKLEMRDIFQYASIAQLAPKISKLEQKADQSVITGTVPLNPIQENFFSDPMIYPFHYNQAVMLYSKEGFDEEAVRAVFIKIQEHHDTLRMSYKKEGQKVIQVNHGLEYPFSLQVYDLRNRENAREALEKYANEIQESIHLEKGPLMKIGLFHLDKEDRLLIAVHHLVMDGVSWRILFEDIETLYRQYIKEEPLVLPLKTDSFKLWSEKLSQYADSAAFLKEKKYWAQVESMEIPGIKRDFDGENSHGDLDGLSFSLSEAESDDLLTGVNEAFGTEVNDILLTALGLSIRKTFGNTRVLIALEGHGREEIPGINISRTVGWFTSLYPVILNISYKEDLARQIKEVKENLHQLPNKGIGYGILKYLTAEENREGIQFKLKPQICFNYFGQFAADIQQVSFGVTRDSTGNLHSMEELRRYELDISGMISDKRLVMSIGYSRERYKRETMETLLKYYQEELRRIISYCSSRGKKQLTPSDFTYKELSIEDIGAIDALFSN